MRRNYNKDVTMCNCYKRRDHVASVFSCAISSLKCSSIAANGPAIHHVHQAPPGDHVDGRARARLGEPLPSHGLLHEEGNV